MRRRVLLLAALAAVPLAALALADGGGTGPAPDDARSGTHEAGSGHGFEPDPGSGRFTLTPDQLPASDGWFLVPVESDAGTAVHVEVDTRLDNTDERAKAAVPVVAQHDEVWTPLYLEVQRNETEAHAGGETVSCCGTTDRFDGRRGRSGWSGWFGTSPETPLYVGLVASGWTDSDEFRIRVSSSQADVRPGTVATGTEVHRVNLFEEAARGEPGVRFEENRLAGDHDDVELRWTADEAGLLAAGWDYDGGSGRGDLHVTLPNGSAVDTAPSQGTEGHIGAVTDPGTTILRFTNASRSQEDHWSVALFADVDLPYRELRVRR